MVELNTVMRRKGVSSILTITNKTRSNLGFNILLVMNSNNGCGVFITKHTITKHTIMKTILITLCLGGVAMGNSLPPCPQNTLPPTWELVSQVDFAITPHLEA